MQDDRDSDKIRPLRFSWNEIKPEKPKRKLEILIIYETPLKSWLVDGSAFAMFAGLWGLGWVSGSAAMQWCAFLVAAIIVLGWAIGKGDKKYTVEAARERLDEIEKEMKGE